MGLLVTAVNYVDLRVELLFAYPRLKQIRDSILSELVTARESGGTPNILYLKSPLSDDDLANKGEKFQVISLGGTNYRSTCLIAGDDLVQQLKTANIKSGAIPRFTSKQVLLDFIMSLCEPDIECLALNFAYPMQPEEIDGFLDGKLVGITKEHTFEGLVGQYVGQEIRHERARLGHKDIEVTVANDTICLLLSALDLGEYDDLVAGVVGTGINFGIFETKNCAINLEMGFFSNFESSGSGKVVDQNSQTPGQSLFEKEISGAYLFQHFNQIVQTHGLSLPMLSSSAEMSAIAAERKPGVELAEMLLERSASLSAAAISAIYKFKTFSRTDAPKLTFAMEGGLFWEAKGYTDYVKKYMLQLGVPEGSVEFVNVEHSSLLGAAHLLV